MTSAQLADRGVAGSSENCSTAQTAPKLEDNQWGGLLCAVIYHGASLAESGNSTLFTFAIEFLLYYSFFFFLFLFLSLFFLFFLKKKLYN